MRCSPWCRIRSCVSPDADFTQTQRYDLHADASLVMVDWITSGRHASGERWAFSRYESRFDIRRGSQRIFFDALVLEPQIDSVVERMGRFDVLLTAVITGPLVAAAAMDIVSALSQAIPSIAQADLVVFGRRGFATAERCCAWPARASSRWGMRCARISPFCRR